MGIEHTGAPTFSISGSPSTIRDKATTMRSRSSQYQVLSDSLSSLSTDGWTGRAADRFREKFSVEPGRWQQAATGFANAADALDLYATSLENAQATASDCKSNYEEGNRITKEAREEYNADVERGKQEKREWEAENGPGTYTLTIEPFSDPGETMRDQAVSDFDSAVNTLESEAQTCANTIRASCEGAPESRNWFETGLAAVGDFLYGALEACEDLNNLLFNITYGPIKDLIPLLTGELTPEELAMKWQLKGESVCAFGEALWENPLEVGKEIGKGVLDWDTWADNPARALGHLAPDIVMAVATVGTGTAATKSSSLLARLGAHADDVGDVAGAARRADRAADAAETAGKLEKLDLAEAGKAPKDLPESGLTREAWEQGIDEWSGKVADANPGLDQRAVRGLHRYTTDEGYTAMNGALRGGGGSAETQRLIEDATRALDRLPTPDPGDLHRGTALPKGVVDKMLDERVFSDPAFLSTSRNSSVAADFAETAAEKSPGNIPVEFRIKGGTAPDVQPLSAYANEAEHLYRPGAKFKILEMTEKQFGSRQGWKVIMEE